MQNIVLSDARLTRRYYERRALSMIGAGPNFRLGKAVLGGGCIEMVNGEPSVKIPIDISEIKTPFLTLEPIYTYANGRILIRAVVPKGKVPAGRQYEFTTLNLLDSEGGLVAVLASTPIWMHSDRSLGLDGYIETNIS